MLRRIDQFHPSLTFGDAVSNDCFELQRLLWVWGLRSDLYAEFATPEVRRFVREERDLPAARRDDELLLVHLSIDTLPAADRRARRAHARDARPLTSGLPIAAPDLDG